MDKEQLETVVGKTVSKVEVTNLSMEITFDDGTVLYVVAGGAGEIWLNADLTE